MAKLVRIMQRLQRSLARFEAMLIFAGGGEDFLKGFYEAHPEHAPDARPLTRAEIKATSKPADEIEATEGAIELAEEKGIDLSGIEGSGEDGRIVKDDVKAALKEASKKK